MSWDKDILENIKRAQSLLARNRQALPSVFSFAHAMPVAAWIKAIDGTMIWVNSAYENRFGKPLETYHGADDEAVWGLSTALHFGGNDALAVEAGAPILVDEDCPMPDGRMIKLRFWKFPVYHSETRQLLGVGGVEVLA